MKPLLIIGIYTVLLFLLNFLSKKFNFLLDKKKLPHKIFASNNIVPLTGGLVLIISLFFLSHNFFFLVFALLIFILGILSDLQIIESPLKKFIIQFIIVFFFLYFSDLNIISTKVFFIDNFIQNKIFSILFTTFCLLILINGTNFIDGINTLVCGYYILILAVVLYVGSINSLHFNFNDYYYLLFCLVVIYIFNLFSKTYLGDSGSFLLGFVVGSNLINFSNDNLTLLRPVSPIFILLLLWYPAFENFFSIMRRLIHKTYLSKPDNHHLHQLLFMFFKSNFRNKIINKYINSFTGNLINFYNLIIFVLASQFYFHTKYLCYLAAFNILIYLFLYFFIIKLNLRE